MFNLIRDCIRENHGRSPTLREVGTLMGFLSVNGVMCHIRALERKGVIARNKRQSRGIQVLVDEPISARWHGGTIELDCGDRVYVLDQPGAALLGALLTQLAGPVPRGVS